MTQWEILLRTHNRIYYILDRRGHCSEYNAFDIVHRDEPHTIAPNRKFALEVRDAYLAWAEKYSPAGLAVLGDVVTRKVER